LNNQIYIPFYLLKIQRKEIDLLISIINARKIFIFYLLKKNKGLFKDVNFFRQNNHSNNL